MSARARGEGPHLWVLRRVACPTVVIAALTTSACAPPLMRLPSGPAPPASDALPALTEATKICRSISSMVADVSVRGSVASRRLRGRLEVGLSAPDSARLDAAAPFGLLFTFVAKGDDATLVLHRDDRVLEHGRPAAVLEAVTGVPLDAAGLRFALTGCAPDATVVEATRPNDGWRIVVQEQHRLYLSRAGEGSAWRLVAAVYGDAGRTWRAEYREFKDGLPREVRLVSAEDGRFDLRLSLSQIEMNIALGPEVFEVKVPVSATPMTLEELRASGPLADAGDEEQGVPAGTGRAN